MLPELTLEIDSIAEGENTVGVEWHVQFAGEEGFRKAESSLLVQLKRDQFRTSYSGRYGESAFPLGRGLSQARVCTRSGKIERVVDIAEAPWRVIGLVRNV